MPSPPALDPTLLGEHRDWLRALATRLAGAADAEDLVQDAYEAALEKPPATDRPLRPWLAQVVRNLAAMRRRSRSRAAVREHDVLLARDAPPSPEALLARAQAMRELAELVVALPEPLRTTLLLRYDEGLTAERIASLQGVPAGTVRWRLKTALDRLREGMDGRRGEAPRAWRALFVAPGAALGAGAGRAAVAAGGALLMKKTIAIVAAVLLLLAAGWWLVAGARRTEGAAGPAGGARAATAGGGSAGAAAPGTPGSASPAGAPAPAGAADAGVDLGASGRSAVVAADPAPLGVFEGRVVNWSTGEGVAGVELSFAAQGSTAAVSVVSGDGGRFELQPATAAPHVLVTASKAGFLPYAPEWGQSPVRLVGRPGQRVRDIVFFLFPAVDYTGRVVDPAGNPVAGAVVRLVGAPQGEQALETIADRYESGPDGRFTFHAPDDAVFEARHPKFGPGRARLDGMVAVSHQLLIHLAPAGQGKDLGRERLAGRVVDERGGGVGGAQVRATPLLKSPDALPAQFATTDEDGRFALDDLDPGDVELAVSHDSFAPATALARAGKSDVVVTLAGGGSLWGRVVDASGAAVPSFTVLIAAKQGLRRPLVATRSVVDADGRFEIAHLTPGDYAVTVAARGFAPAPEVTATAPGETTLHLARGGAIAGKVTTKGGAPLGYARVMLESGGGASIAPANAGTVTAEDGRFLLTGVPAGQETISVGAGEHHVRLVGGIQVTDGVTAGPIEVELRPTAPGETPQLDLVGIGVKLDPGDDALVVSGVIPGGGAEAAGVVVGDKVVAVDGAPVTELGMAGAIGRIRGAEGTVVRITIRRADGSIVELAVPRRRLRT